MAGRILIAFACPEKAGELETSLAAAGCEIFRANNLEAASHLLHQNPDLLLLDITLAENATSEQRSSLATELELAETFCLRVCASEQEFFRGQQLVPFACGTIYPTGSTEQILEQIDTLLRIKTAEMERNRAQEKLILHRMEVEEGLRSAAMIQHALLPNRPPDTNAFSFAWQFIPCETVGGDLFNLLQLSENCLMAYILDVSGHGVSSAMVTVSVFQSLSDRTSQLVKHPLDHPPYFRIADPAEVVNTLDQVYPFERFDKFFTIAYLLLDPQTGRISYCNGGHPPPILLHQNGSLDLLETGGPLVGLGGMLPFEQGEIFMQPGDRLFLYSDGITEYANPSGEMFGDQRMIDFFRERLQPPLDAVAKNFMESLHCFGEGIPPADDVSLFCIQFNASSKTKRRRSGIKKPLRDRGKLI